jgi:hypothetical protein
MIEVNDYQYRKIGPANFSSIDVRNGFSSTGRDTGNFSSNKSK